MLAEHAVTIADVTVPGDLVALFIALAVVLATACLGLFGWGLAKVVELAQVVAGMKEQKDDHERRLTRLEQQGQP